MEFIKKLNSIGLLNGGTALDIGAGELFESKRLLEANYKVDAIDRIIPKTTIEGVHFIQRSIEDYTFEKKYDLIFAQNILFFTSNPLVMLEKIFTGTADGGLVCFTLLGENDEWNTKDNITCLTKEKIESFLVDSSVETIFKSEEEGLGQTMSKNLKHWHMFRYIVRKK